MCAMLSRDIVTDVSDEPTKNPDWVAFGERLTKAMKHAGLTGLALSKKSDVSDGNISKMRSGKRGPPNAETVQALADGCGVRVEWLTDGREPMTEGPRFPRQEAQDGLEEAYFTIDWWNDLAMPTPEESKAVFDDAASSRALKGTWGVPARIWAEDLKSRLRERRRPDKAVGGAIVSDAGTDNPLDDLGGGFGAIPPPKRRRK
jgi:transcriptional regulator with XRE-family HTH domain